MRYLMLIPLVILLLGFHVIDPPIGAVVVLAALALSGVLWRMLKIVTGLTLMFVGFL